MGDTDPEGSGPQRVKCISSPRTRRVSCRGGRSTWYAVTWSNQFCGGWWLSFGVMPPDLVPVPVPVLVPFPLPFPVPDDPFPIPVPLPDRELGRGLLGLRPFAM
jgi:hypothetical protein